MSMNVSQKLIASHLISGEMRPGAEIGLRMDQGLLQDVLGTLVMLELEAMGSIASRSSRRCSTSTTTWSQSDH